MNVIFLGDSITDAGRNTTNGSTASIGQGYALIVAAKLGAVYPGQYICTNAGVSGSRVVSLYARIKTDVWNRQPDLISVLVGVNDVWHEFAERNGVEADRYEIVYRMLLADTIKRHPDAQFLLLEPFCLRASATEEHWPEFRREVALRAAAVRCLADEFQCRFVPLQARFNEACLRQEASYWLADGVHPTPAGHQLIADAWLEAFQTMQCIDGDAM